MKFDPTTQPKQIQTLFLRSKPSLTPKAFLPLPLVCTHLTCRRHEWLLQGQPELKYKISLIGMGPIEVLYDASSKKEKAVRCRQRVHEKYYLGNGETEREQYLRISLEKKMERQRKKAPAPRPDKGQYTNRNRQPPPAAIGFMGPHGSHGPHGHRAPPHSLPGGGGGQD